MVVFIMLNKSIDKRDQYKMISISDLVANSHLLRIVDAILDLNFVYELVEYKGKMNINMVIVNSFLKN